jgi:hypothetical protein
VTVEGHPAPTVTVAELLPAGLTLSEQGLLSGTPEAGTGGTYPLTITASNGVDPIATQTFTLSINSTPTFTSADATTMVVGTAGSFNITATSYPAATFSLSGDLPAGLSLSAAGLLSGTPEHGTGGTYELTVTASNGSGQDALQVLTLTINEAPQITSANAVSFDVGDPDSSFQVTASGYPAATYSVSGILPAGISLNTSGLLSGTAAEDGVFVVTITASNGVHPDATQSFTLTTVAPVIIPNDDITVTNDPGQNGAVVSYGHPATEGYVGIVTCTPESGTLFPIGTSTVNCESSTSTATASFDVTVTDTEPPVIEQPADVEVYWTGPTGAVVTFADPVVTDNAPGVTWECEAPSGSLFPLGETTVTCSAADVAGNTASVTFNVSVRTSIQACMIAGPLKDVSPLYGGGVTSTLSCGPKTAIVLSYGTDYQACLHNGKLSQFTTTTTICNHGMLVTFAAGTDYHGCLHDGTLTRVGTSIPTCGKGGVLVSLAQGDLAIAGNA